MRYRTELQVNYKNQKINKSKPERQLHNASGRRDKLLGQFLLTLKTLTQNLLRLDKTGQFGQLETGGTRHQVAPGDSM